MGIPNIKALRDWILLRGVNHMLATEKGYFMDARLGPVIQGELDKLKASVSEINGNLGDYLKYFGRTDFSADSAAKKPRGIYENVEIAYESFNIPRYSTIFKTRDDNFDGSFLICRQHNTLYGGLYVYKGTVDAFVKLSFES